ncbi:MAG: UbiA family prenyltransferase [Bdellovibrionota bacterium]
MGVPFSRELMMISVLVGILTVVLLLSHAFMDFDSDKKNNKKTLLVRLKTKERALNFLFLLVFISYVLIFLLVYFKIISCVGLIAIFTLPMVYRLYTYLKEYIKNPLPNVFLRNFKLARNLVSSLDVILAIAIIF